MASIEKPTSLVEVDQADPNLVTFSGSDDPAFPRNWRLSKKWLTVTIVSLFAALNQVTSTMIAPSLPQMSVDFNVQGDRAVSQLMLSIVFLGYTLGPLITSPLSEVYGRTLVLQLGSILFLIFNLGSGFAQSQTQMIVFRFIAGIGGSTALGIGGGVLGDCFEPEERGLAVSIYELAPLLGPAIGPILGAYITEYSTWRWCFWATSIGDVVVQLLGLAFLQETWAPTVLKRKKNSLINTTGNVKLYTLEDVDKRGRTISSRLREALTRPLSMLKHDVIVQILCLYMAYLYGVALIVLSTFTSLWTDRYGYSLGAGSLNYLALAFGYTLGTQVSARLNDRVYKYLKNKNQGCGIPEYRLPMMMLGAPLMASGLLIYGWTAQYRAHWIAVDIGVACYAAGTFTCFQCLQTYLIDTYTTYAASATGAATLLRSIFATAFPLFAPKLYEKLDYGWGTTTLALISVAFGLPSPLLLWNFGPALRAKSSSAAANS